MTWRKRAWIFAGLLALLILGATHEITSIMTRGHWRQPTATFRLEPGEAMTELTPKDIVWIASTIIEAESFDCNVHIRGLETTAVAAAHYCDDPGRYLSISYYFSDSGIVARLQGPGSNGEDQHNAYLKQHLEHLAHSFEAAGFLYIR